MGNSLCYFCNRSQYSKLPCRLCFRKACQNCVKTYHGHVCIVCYRCYRCGRKENLVLDQRLNLMTCPSHDEPRPSMAYQGRPITVDLNYIPTMHRFTTHDGASSPTNYFARCPIEPMLMTVDQIEAIEVAAFAPSPQLPDSPNSIPHDSPNPISPESPYPISEPIPHDSPYPIPPFPPFSHAFPHARLSHKPRYTYQMRR